MFILTTPEGGAYHGTDGMPCLFVTMKQLESAIACQRGPDEWDALELTPIEAHKIHEQALLAIFGRRIGLDL